MLPPFRVFEVEIICDEHCSRLPVMTTPKLVMLFFPRLLSIEESM